MSDDLGKKGKEDAIRINVKEEWELNDWSEKLDVTKEQLKKAVEAVGDSVDAVKKYLGK